MAEVRSCCGMICSGCEYFPGECSGCPALQGRVFWLQYVDDAVCPIYHCCVEERELTHCGQCASLPCSLYDKHEDPNVSKEDAEACMKGQLERMRRWLEEEAAECSRK